MPDAVDEHALYHRFAARARGYGLRHLRDPQLAQELVQQVMLILIEALREGRVNDVDRLESYVLGTCRNVVMDMRRGVGRQRKLIAHAAGEPVTYEAEWPQLKPRRLEGCLGQLVAAERAIMFGTFVEERDAGDLGRDLGLTPGNVRVIRHRTVAKLQRCLESPGPA